jgi:hypothetical protein
MNELVNSPLGGEALVGGVANTEAGEPAAVGATEGAPVTTMPPHPDFDALCCKIEEAGREAMQPDAENRQVLFERAISEVMDLRADAIKIYARYARDADVRRKAHKTRRHAERRVGELLIAAERADVRYIRQKDTKIGAPIGVLTLKKVGITRRQSGHWQWLARMSGAAFETWLESELTKKSQRSRRATTDTPPGGAGALVPIRPGIKLPGTVSKAGWQLPGTLSFEDWVACGQLLDSIEGSVQ